MKSKWSKVIKSENRRLAVESFEMAELIPFLARNGGQRQIPKEEDGEPEPPHDCSILQQQAFEAGREAGIEEGKAECRHEVEQERQRSIQLVEQIEVARTNLLGQVEADLVALALAIAKKVIHREASLDKDIVVNQIQHILKNLSVPSGVCLKVHPDEMDHLQNVQASFVTHEGDTPTIRIEGDPAIGLGGCIIQTNGLCIDAAIEQQLENIGETLELQEESHESHVSSSTS